MAEIIIPHCSLVPQGYFDNRQLLTPGLAAERTRPAGVATFWLGSGI